MDENMNIYEKRLLNPEVKESAELKLLDLNV